MKSSLPNILLLFTDQQRYDTIAALGNTLIRTPALDRLAREGTAFTRAYTPSPVCVAARCALMTGLPPHVTGCLDNDEMPEKAESFVERLGSLGYQTHGVGKMHFTPDYRRPWGFDSRDTCEELQPDDDLSQWLRAEGFGHVQEIHGIRSEYYYIPQPSQLPTSHHPTCWVGDRSIEFLRRRDVARPFFLMSSFVKPHPPFESPTPWNKLYRAVEMPPPIHPPDCEQLNTFWNEFQNRFKYRGAWGEDEMLIRTLRAAYYSAISLVDFQVGRILDALESDLDNTLVIFTSDHGELLGDYGCVGKRTMHEVSSRVPLLVRWPAAFRQGLRCETPATLLDVFPTVLLAAGERVQPHSEGAPLMEVAKMRRLRVVFSQFQRRGYAQYLASDGRWKYSYSASDRRATLIDLGADPSETQNLIVGAGHAEADRLRSALQARYVCDHYTDAFDGRDWRCYPMPTLPSNPLESVIFQDPVGTEASLRDLGPGYFRPAAFAVRGVKERLRAIGDESGTAAGSTKY